MDRSRLKGLIVAGACFGLWGLLLFGFIYYSYTV